LWVHVMSLGTHGFHADFFDQRLNFKNNRQRRDLRALVRDLLASDFQRCFFPSVSHNR
jgi:hypothetical protein